MLGAVAVMSHEQLWKGASRPVAGLCCQLASVALPLAGVKVPASWQVVP